MSPRESIQLPCPEPRQSKRGEDTAGRVDDTDAGGTAVDLALADEEVAFGVAGDVHGALDVVPELDELAVEGEELDAVVLAVADDDAVAVDDEAVGQVEVVGLGLAGLTPGLDQLALAGEAVDAGVAVAVGDVEIAGGRGDQLGGVVERAGGAGTRSPGTSQPVSEWRPWRPSIWTGLPSRV